MAGNGRVKRFSNDEGRSNFPGTALLLKIKSKNN
jgi:hypothetical protein